MKKFLLLYWILIPSLLFGQSPATGDFEAKNNRSNLADTISRIKSSLSLQLQAGTQGLGADLRYAVLPALSMRLGASFIPVTVKNAFTFSGFESRNDVDVKFSNVHLLADFVPFANIKGFRLVGGAGYLFEANGGVNVVPTGNYNYGEIALTPAQVGKVNIDVSWQGLAPYLGIGLFKSFPKKLFNINIDLGSYYLTTPKTTIVGTGMLSGNDSQEELINSNMSSYRWLPVAQLNFNFKLK